MYNKAIIMGNIGKMKAMNTSNGNRMVYLSVATNRNYIDKKSGEKKQHTTWHNVNVFDKTAEIVEKYLQVGDSVLIEGVINHNRRKKDDGTEEHIYSITADNVRFLTAKGQEHGGTKKAQSAMPELMADDDIPF